MTYRLTACLFQARDSSPCTCIHVHAYTPRDSTLHLRLPCDKAGLQSTRPHSNGHWHGQSSRAMCALSSLAVLWRCLHCKVIAALRTAIGLTRPQGRAKLRTPPDSGCRL